MPLSQTQRTQTVAAMRLATDEYLRQPLWLFHPYYAPFVLAERTRRGFNLDPEPIGDPAYT